MSRHTSEHITGRLMLLLGLTIRQIQSTYSLVAFQKPDYPYCM